MYLLMFMFSIYNNTISVAKINKSNIQSGNITVAQNRIWISLIVQTENNMQFLHALELTIILKSYYKTSKIV